MNDTVDFESTPMVESIDDVKPHATFQSIGIFSAFFFVLFVIAMAMFEIAVHLELNRLFAPRSYARPKEIIKNQLKQRPYCIRWVPWVLRLSYSEMMEGVNGTGTRNKGWSGSKLRCNLDGVILIKFCVLALKVSILATFLCMVVILPINYTVPCNPEHAIDGQAVCGNETIKNGYEQTTYANIPTLFYGGNTTWYRYDAFIQPFQNESADTTFRMFAILFVAFAIYIYTCVLIWEEWIQNLALRRVYYLEFNHYKNRKEELEQLENPNYPEDINITNRPVFVPHPELRDTVPNIGLYSVMFRLPGVQIDSTCSSDSYVGHQLQIAIDFFDKVVPNQPGFSSSVAALSILPDVKRLSNAWKIWFDCASKVRRLKFIQQRLKQVRLGLHDSKPNSQKIKISNDKSTDQYDARFETSQSHVKNSIKGGEKLDTVDEVFFSNEIFVPNEEQVSTMYETNENNFNLKRIACTISRKACIKNDLENTRVFATTEVNEESNMEMFLDDDEIEQMTVYYREFARSSASCGPRGCDEYSILKADAITLEDLEQEAAEEVHTAIEDLRQARIEIRSDKKPKKEKKSKFRFAPFSFVTNDHSEGVCDDREDLSVTDSKEDGISSRSEKSSLWLKAEKLVGSEQYFFKRRGEVRKRTLSSGQWYNPFVKSEGSKRVIPDAIPSGVLSRIIKFESYSVVTFTSRQAAIAARQCLADGSGLEGWKEIDKIPIAPLADAVPWNIFDCRGCCKPVTVTLPREQKGYRKKILMVIMVAFTALWTYPYVKLLLNTTPDKLQQSLSQFPFLAKNANVLSLITKSLSMMLFFAVLPQFFKALSNFGSGATSIQEAERHALFYFWWFMVVFAFGSITLGNSIIAAFQNNEVSATTFQSILFDLANSLPVETSSFWITWILQQALMVLPFMYFLQFNNFLFTALRWDCAARATAGGGPGGVVPYRIYVNVGIIFLCVVALAPLCPMLAPVGMLCLLFIIPMMKWSHIFVYRPIFDAGGKKWPLLHDIMMTAVFGSQIVLTISFVLKKGFIVAILSALSTTLTWTFGTVCKDTFGQSYSDAALLQTSELDGWNVEDETSMVERERYRKWLVDCHKASYVPICVNAEDNFLTSEPAVVIPSERDQDIEVDFFQPSVDLPFEPHDNQDHLDGSSSPASSGRQRTSTLDSFSSYRSQRTSSQRGALFRRVMGPSVLQLPTGGPDSLASEGGRYERSPTTFPHQFIETKTENGQCSKERIE